MKRNSNIKSGEENPLFKKLTNVEIEILKKLRFVERKTIKEIMNIMKINQTKYYHYINL
jgi:hypothetical protein